MAQTQSPSNHPWLASGRFPAVETLSPALRVYTFLAAHAAAGDTAGVANDWSYLEEADRANGLEIVLQTVLFGGFPRTINALAAIRQASISADGSAASSTQTDTAPQQQDFRQLGEATCKTVYGDVYERLRRRMHALSPDLDDWMLEFGYGRVLSRPGPTLREREVCAIAVLAGQNVAPQLTSHLRGAMRVGATRGECRAILDQTAAVWGDDAQAQADAVWFTYEKARYDL